MATSTWSSRPRATWRWRCARPAGVEEGLLLVDEVLAAVCSGEVEDLYVIEACICGMFLACERANDVVRAEQWLRAIEDDGRPHLVGVAGVLPGPLRRHPHRRRPLARGRGRADRRHPAARRQLRRHAGQRARPAGRPPGPPGPVRGGQELLAGLDDWPEAFRPGRRSTSPRASWRWPATCWSGRWPARRWRPSPDRSSPCWSTWSWPTGGGRARRAAERLADQAERRSGHYLRAARPGAGQGVPGRGLRRRPRLPAGGAGVLRRGPDAAGAGPDPAGAGPGGGRRPARGGGGRGAGALAAFERLNAARNADAAAALLRSLGGPARAGPGGGAADQAGGGGPRPARPRPVQPRDRRAPLHQPQDRRAPRRPRPRQARPAQPGRGGRLRGAHVGPDRPRNRGAPRCSGTPPAASWAHDQRLRRHRGGRPLRRLAHRHAPGPGGPPGPAGRPGHVPERHRVDPLHPPPGVAALARWGLLDRSGGDRVPADHDSTAFDFGPFTLTGHARTAFGRPPHGARQAPGGGGRRGRGRGPRGLHRRRACWSRTATGSPASAATTPRRRVERPGGGRRRRQALAGRGGRRGAGLQREADLRRPTTPTGAACPRTGSSCTSAPTGRGRDPHPRRPDPAWSPAGRWPSGRLPGRRRGQRRRALDLAPDLAERVRRRPGDRFHASGDLPSFFRQPFGPGWALVGDAGYTIDPTTAQGISDAFRDAERWPAPSATAWPAAARSTRRWRRPGRPGRRGPADVRVHARAGDLEPPPPDLAESSRPRSATRRRWTPSSRMFAGVMPVPSSSTPTRGRLAGGLTAP